MAFIVVEKVMVKVSEKKSDHKQVCQLKKPVADWETRAA